MQPFCSWTIVPVVRSQPPFPLLSLGLVGLAKSLSVARNGSAFFQDLFVVLSSQGDCPTPATLPHPCVNCLRPSLTNERPLPATR